ncbi:MAG: hypothetical protein KCHDKBKB_00990 [Elusimicrobia bacterium]|nr:hypothetical protein [Elusimicrobiota bacterium]
MKRATYFSLFGAVSLIFLMKMVQFSNAEEAATVSDPTQTESIPSTEEAEDLQPQATPTPPPAVEPKKATKSKPNSYRQDRADAFLAGADWDFDGFVAGGQGSEIRSMFYLNDLVYLNIGSEQGLGVGDKIGIYKRGQKVKDPQTGKFIGYEVRRAAIARVTDRIEDETAAVRIRSTYEPVEIGDLVRREQ